MRKLWRRLVWYGFKLPMMLTVIMIGFVMEYLFMLPFMIACLLSGPCQHRKQRSRS